MERSCWRSLRSIRWWRGDKILLIVLDKLESTWRCVVEDVVEVAVGAAEVTIGVAGLSEGEVMGGGASVATDDSEASSNWLLSSCTGK